MEQKNHAPNDAEDKHELTSWKEIAHHLGVNVRTAQKWERDRGLPVRRFSGARSRVTADVATIDNWRNAKTLFYPELDCYRWPLGPTVIVEIRFVGTNLTRDHVDLFRQYLDLFKTSFP